MGVSDMGGIIQQARGFLEVPFNRYLILALVLIGLFVFLSESQTPQTRPSPTANISNNISQSNITVHFFYLPTCPHCAEQKPVNEELMKEFPQVPFVYHDVTNPREGELLSRMYQEYNLDTSRIGVPTTFVGKQAFVGFESKEVTGTKIRNALIACLQKCANQTVENVIAKEPAPESVDLPFLGKTRIADFSLPMLAVVLGLVDGFNPCAMWVLVYLIALVMSLNDRKKIWLIVGSFVFASGALYFLFMTAWLNVFLFIGYVRAVTIIIGLAALGGGIISLREWWGAREEKALTCKVGDKEDKEKTITRMQEIISRPLTWTTLLAIVALAFVVNSIEFVCSAAIPAIFTQVLALSSLSWVEHYGYILLYVFFYMLDDLIIFSLAAFAVSSSNVGERYAKHCKLIGGVILLFLGLMLLFAPNLLR
jgi:thiol-disulfide isomerase/thioredoxin